MSRRKPLFALGLLVAVAATAPAAYAQASSPEATKLAADFPACTKAGSGDNELARQKFIAARQDYEEGNYDSALRRFRDAYNLDCTKPELLLIVSAAYERKGDKPSALAALELFTQRAPKDSPDLPTTQAKIENLKKQIAAAPPPSPPTTNTTSSGETQEHGIAPWILVGVGGAAIATGIILLATSSLPANCHSDKANCDQGKNETDAQLAQDEQDAGNAKGRGTAGIITLAGGGAMVVGGLIWHFLEPTGKSSSARLTPSVSPGFAGLSLGGRF